MQLVRNTGFKRVKVLRHSGFASETDKEGTNTVYKTTESSLKLIKVMSKYFKLFLCLFGAPFGN